MVWISLIWRKWWACPGCFLLCTSTSRRKNPGSTHNYLLMAGNLHQIGYFPRKHTWVCDIINWSYCMIHVRGQRQLILARWAAGNLIVLQNRYLVHQEFCCHHPTSSVDSQQPLFVLSQTHAIIEPWKIFRVIQRKYIRGFRWFLDIKVSRYCEGYSFL